MKKIFISLLVLSLTLITNNVLANEIEVASQTDINQEMAENLLFHKESETITLTGETTFDWLDMSQLERDTIIENYKKIIFGDDTVYKYKKKEFNEKYKDFLKDENNQTHYIEASNGITETKYYKLCGFYSGRILVSYAIQYKDNPRTAYYYNAFGKLIYVDVISDNYPNFPYWSKQYKANGKMISAIYFVSHDMQYMYKPNGEFQGVWFKDKRYTQDAKQDLTRSNW